MSIKPTNDVNSSAPVNPVIFGGFANKGKGHYPNVVEMTSILASSSSVVNEHALQLKAESTHVAALR